MHAFVIVVLLVLILDLEALLLEALNFEVLHNFDVFLRVAFRILLGITLVIELHWLAALVWDTMAFRDLSEDDFEFFNVILDSLLHAGVPMVLDGVVGSAFQDFCDFGPLVFE